MVAANVNGSVRAPLVEVVSGKLRGLRIGEAYAFLGVPYARAARFRAPQAAAPWAGVRDVAEFGPSAPQTNPDPGTAPPAVILAHLPRPAGAPAPKRPVESEECQVLNVWTGSLDAGARLPVMVWLHGGFFSSGSGSTIDGTSLARRHGVVVVSINHRVNAFGFTDLSRFGGGEFGDSANAGMLDIVAALAWIRENISQFGGDPARVTVFGTSGGGMKTSILMASPLARGLLHRAAVQSGPGLRFLTRDESVGATERLLAEAGLSPAEANDLAAFSPTDLLRAYHRVAASMPPRRFTDLPAFAPVVDGALLLRQPFSPDADPATAGIPLIIGSNTDEMSFFMGNDPAAFELDEAGYEARIAELAPDRAGALAAHYRAAMPDASPSQRWIRLFSDYSIMRPTMAQASRHAEAGGRIFVYRLAFQSPALGGKLGATHTIETPLIFDNVPGNPLLAGSERAAGLASAMARYWTAFAADGTPDVPGLPAWDAFSDAEAEMRFGGEPELNALQRGARTEPGETSFWPKWP